MIRSNIDNISVRLLWVVAILAGIFIFLNTQPIRPHDFWWHLAIGREILGSGQIPTVDEYSYTMAGTPYPSYQMFWLMDVFLYLLFKSGGPALVIFTHSLIVSAAYLIITTLCWQISRSWAVTTICLFFTAALGVHNWNVRPQAISYLIGVIFMYAIYAYRERPKTAWLAVFPLGMLAWANSHGSFVIGFLFLGLWLSDETWQVIKGFRSSEQARSFKRLLPPTFVLLLSGLACLLNPGGLGVVTYLWTMASSPVIQNLVPEWAPPTLNEQIGAIFIIGLLSCAAVLSLSPRRPSFYQLVTFLIFALLGLKTTRGIIWFGFAMAPVLADHLAALGQLITTDSVQHHQRSGSLRLNLVFLLILLTLTIASLPWFKPLLPFPPVRAGLISQETPISATQYLLEHHTPGYLFHDMSFGSYLIWAAQPNYQVFVDPRIELFDPDIWQDYIRITNAIPGWEQKFEEYGVQTLMISPVEQPALIEAAGRSDSWLRVYQDQAAVIFIKMPPN